MIKNRIFSAFAFAGLLGFTACAAEEEAPVIEEPVVEEPAPIVEPAPAPMMTDTAAMPMDTMGGMGAPADTAGL